MKAKLPYFLLYTLILWLCVSTIGIVMFWIWEPNVSNTLLGVIFEQFLTFDTIIIIFFLNMLPYSAGVGARVFKLELEQEAPFEQFIRLVASSIGLFFIGMCLTSIWIVVELNQVESLSISGEVQITSIWAGLSMSLNFWLTTFPLNLAGIIVLVVFHYFFQGSIDRRVFKGVKVAKKRNQSLWIYFTQLAITIFVCMLIVTASVYNGIEFFLHQNVFNDSVVSYGMRVEGKVFFIALSVLPYALIVASAIFFAERLQEVSFRRKALVFSLVLTLVLAAIIDVFTFAWINYLPIGASLWYGMTLLPKSLSILATSFPVNILVCVLIISMTHVWYRYIGQLRSVDSAVEEYEHLITNE